MSRKYTGKTRGEWGLPRKTRLHKLFRRNALCVGVLKRPGGHILHLSHKASFIRCARVHLEIQALS